MRFSSSFSKDKITCKMFKHNKFVIDIRSLSLEVSEREKCMHVWIFKQIFMSHTKRMEKREMKRNERKMKQVNWWMAFFLFRLLQNSFSFITVHLSSSLKTDYNGYCKQKKTKIRLISYKKKSKVKIRRTNSITKHLCVVCSLFNFTSLALHRSHTHTACARAMKFFFLSTFLHTSSSRWLIFIHKIYEKINKIAKNGHIEAITTVCVYVLGIHVSKCVQFISLFRQFLHAPRMFPGCLCKWNVVVMINMCIHTVQLSLLPFAHTPK